MNQSPDDWNGANRRSRGNYRNAADPTQQREIRAGVKKRVSALTSGDGPLVVSRDAALMPS